MEKFSSFQFNLPICSRQVIVSFITSLGILGLGHGTGWSSTALPSLANDEDFQDLTSEQISWIASLAPFGAVISAPFAGLCLDQFGRRSIIITSAVIQIVGWLFIMLSSEVTTIYIGRFIGGCSGCALGLTIPVYISEITECEVRGCLSSFQQFMSACGLLSSYVLGAFAPWNYLAFLSALPTVVMLLLSGYIPDSPRYFLCIGKTDDAIRVTRWLRENKSEAEVDEEVMAIMLNLEEVRGQADSPKESLLSRHILIPLFSSCILMIIQQLSGANAMVFYTVYIFQMAGASLDPYICTIMVGLILVTFVAISTVLVDGTGRKTLLIISSIVMAISHFTVAIFYALKTSDSEPNVLAGSVPVLAILVYFAAYAIGFKPIPWVIMGEIMPNHVVGFASSLSIFCHHLFAFLVVFYIKDFLNAAGVSMVFAFFGTVCLLGFLFVHYAIPETKLKTLEEVQCHYYGRKYPIMKQVEAYNTFEVTPIPIPNELASTSNSSVIQES